VSKERVGAEDLHRVLEAEVRNLRTGSDWARWLDAAALFPTYGFGNVILITLQMPQASWVAREHAWERLGRRVMKQRAIRILAPIRSQTSTGIAVQEANLRAVSDGRVQGHVIGFRVDTVYDITNTVGPPISLPPMPAPSADAVPNGLWDALEREVSASGYSVSVEPTGDASEGYTDYTAREIVIADHLDEVTAVARLAHELGHVRLHSAPDVVGAGSVMCRGVREVEAESVAYIVLAHHGLSTDASSFDYVAGWAALVDPEQPESVIKATGARVVNAARQVIDSTSQYLKANRPALLPVPARSPDSLFLPPDLDGPAL
jgi:hypothetical protein